MKKCMLLIGCASLFWSTIYALPQKVREQCIEFAYEQLCAGDIADVAANQRMRVVDALFFTPDQAYTLKQIMIGLIDAEQTKIQMALFRLTDSDIAQALIDAHKRGVEIELVVDTGAIGLEHYSRVSALTSHGITVYVYQPIELFSSRNKRPAKRKKQRAKQEAYKSIMHHKTFIFYNTVGGSVVTCGSLNPTYAAFNGNDEAVIIRNDVRIVERWKDHFEMLKQRCLTRAVSRTVLIKNRDRYKSIKKSRK